MAGKRELTPKQQLFVQEYLVDLNATQAAIRAGYSAKNADKIASQLLGKNRVAEAVAQAMARRFRRTGISAERVLEELALVAFADLGDFVEFGPEGIVVKSTEQLDPRVRRALAEVSERRAKHGRTVAFKLHDKVTALTKLGQHLGLFPDRVEHTGKGGGPIQVEGKLSGLTDEELATLEKLLAKAQTPDG